MSTVRDLHDLGTKRQLAKAGKNARQNMAWALNTVKDENDIHSEKYAKAVYEMLEAGWKKDGKEGVEAALKTMSDMLGKGGKFW